MFTPRQNAKLIRMRVGNESRSEISGTGKSKVVGAGYTSKQVSGIKGEDLATSYLRKKGYKIITRNFRARGGEIDIIALDGETLVFIEVKARSTKEFGSPLEAITYRKMKSLIKTAEFYKLKNPKLPEAMRIDAVAITLDGENEVKAIELVKNISC